MAFLQHLNVPDRLHFKAMIFDLDGVVTNTALVHKDCWKKLFDEFMKERTEDGAKDEFTDDDYYQYVDGKPR